MYIHVYMISTANIKIISMNIFKNYIKIPLTVYWSGAHYLSTANDAKQNAKAKGLPERFCFAALAGKFCENIRIFGVLLHFGIHFCEISNFQFYSLLDVFGHIFDHF